MAHDPTDPISRRWLLKSAASAALLACNGDDLPNKKGDDDDDVEDTDSDVIEEIELDVDAIEEDPVVFPITVQAGAIRPTSLLLKTYVEPSQFVTLRVWLPGSDDKHVILAYEGEVEPAEGYLSAVVEELEPGTWYSYAFFLKDDDARSLVGRFRTAPEEGTKETLKLAISACNGGGNDPWPTLQLQAEKDVDLFLHLGDLAYNDGANDLSEYRDSYRWYLSGDGFRQAFAACGMFATWDDHEFDNDWNPETFNPTRLRAALDSYFEVMAVEHDDDQLWRSFLWGDTAEIFVLDCRSERLPSTRNTDEAQYIGPDQWDWLKDRLKKSKATFKIIMNSVPITNMPFAWDLYAVDRWEGYKAQRTEVIDYIADEDIANVYFVAGDFHVNFVGRIEPDGEGVLGKTWEIACTGGNSNILGDTLTPPQFLYGTSRPRTTILTFDPEEESVVARFFDAGTGAIDFEIKLGQQQ